MNELEVRLVLSEDDPMSVEAIADKRDLDREHVVEQLQQLEAFGYVKQTDAGFVDTGKRYAFNEEPDRCRSWLNDMQPRIA